MQVGVLHHAGRPGLLQSAMQECSEGDVKGPSPRRPQLHRDVEVTVGPGEGPSQADRQVWKAQKGRRGLPPREKAE